LCNHISVGVAGVTVHRMLILEALADKWHAAEDTGDAEHAAGWGSAGYLRQQSIICLGDERRKSILMQARARVKARQSHPYVMG